MLGDQQTDLGEVEDLAAFGVDHFGTGEVTATATTGIRHVGDHRIRLGHLGQVLAGGSRLLALLA